jgi:hypothetical protein
MPARLVLTCAILIALSIAVSVRGGVKGDIAPPRDDAQRNLLSGSAVDVKTRLPLALRKNRIAFGKPRLRLLEQNPQRAH